MGTPSEEQSHLIEVFCSCGTKLNMPNTAVGRRARCPKCKEVFVVPEPPADDDPDGVDLESDEGYALVEELAEEAPMIVAGPAPGSGGPPEMCSKCGKRLGAGTSLCGHCGHNHKTKHQHQGASALGAMMSGLMRGAISGAGTYVLGCVLSSVGALIGAAVWCLVAVVTDFEIGWLACGIGILAGVGMSMGYEPKNLRAGVTAACFAVVGIGCAKLMVFVYVNYPELQQARQAISSFGDEELMKRSQVAAHYANLQAQEQGLSYEDAKRERIFDQEYADVEELSATELERAIAEIETWEEGGKWDDPDYARVFLIYSQVDKEMEEHYSQFDELGEEEYVGLPASQWRKMYGDAVASLDSMSAEQQLQSAKDIQRERDREAAYFRLSRHHAELLAMEMGLSRMDQKRTEIRETETERIKQLSDEELDAQIAKLEKWDAGGKWDDASYTRNYLIYAQMDEAMGSWIEDHRDYTDEYDSLFNQEWQRRYPEAVAEVDAIPESERVELAQSTERQQQKDLETFFQDMQAEAAKSMASDAMSFFFKNSFGLFDLLWVFLAVGSAFKIASGGAMED